MTHIASLRFGDLGQVNVISAGFDVTPGVGSHRLIHRVQLVGTWLHAKDPASYAAASLTGTLWLEQPVQRWVASVDPQAVTLRGYHAREELVVDLSDDQFLALERMRDGDLVFRLDLQLVLVRPPTGIHAIAEDQASTCLPASRWIELLSALGREIAVVLRVPCPLVDAAGKATPPASAASTASHAQAGARLRDAQFALRDRRWRDCIVACRGVLENIALMSAVPDAGVVAQTKPEDRTQAQSRAAIFHAVRGMANASHHDKGMAVTFKWTREDADAIFAATASLLNLYTA